MWIAKPVRLVWARAIEVAALIHDQGLQGQKQNISNAQMSCSIEIRHKHGSLERAFLFIVAIGPSNPILDNYWRRLHDIVYLSNSNTTGVF